MQAESARLRSLQMQLDEQESRPPSLDSTLETPADATGETPPAQTLGGGQEVSVESYMEGLRARTRNGHGAPRETPQRPPTPVHPASNANDSRADDDAFDLEEAPAPPSEVLAHAPAHQQDRSTMRANLDSMRELANQSARRDVARHESKLRRRRLLVKVLLTLVSTTMASLMIHGSQVFPGLEDLTRYAWAPAAIAGATSFDLLRSFMSRRK